MANLLIVTDPDPRRRAAFCKVVQPHLAPLDGLVFGECACQDFHALWASGARAPVTSRTNEQRAAVVWGRPIAREDGRAVGETQLAAEWADLDNRSLPIFDGYYAAASYHAERGLVVGADIVGMFPVFWWSSGDVLLVGSSPDLFRHHLLFHFELDLAGLTGILLMMHSVDGRTLMKGVHRLGAGRALVWRRGASPREVFQYELPVSTEHFSLPFSAVVELVNDTLRRSVARHVPPDAKWGLTLSGGRDSRLLAGMMVELGRMPMALTFGSKDDIELQCAIAVAQALHLEHRTQEMSIDQYDLYAERHARLLHCSTSFNFIEYWSWLEGLQALPPYFASAFIMDFIIGGSHVGWVYSKATHTVSFDNLFRRNNAYGIEANTLRQLLRPEIFGRLTDDVIQRVRDIYEAYPGLESQRAWCFDLHHRVRFYTATLPWQFSFASWPVMPSIDRELLEVTGGIPPGVLSERRVQDEIIKTYFPTLAELPVDRNSYNTEPLTPRLRHRIRDNLRGRIEPLTRPLADRRRLERERRIYYRVFDFNGPAWKVARRQAEPHRGKLHGLLNKEVLDRYLPPPDVDLKMADGLIDPSGRKLLIGLCLWAARYL